MANWESFAARRALTIATFARLKDMVRELEENEKRIGQDFGPAEIEFKLNPNEVAWFVAYKTAAAGVTLPSSATQALDQKK
jgi:hypothetical protein